MSGTNIDVAPQTGRSAALSMSAALLAILGAAVTAIYGSYGGPTPSTSQEHAVPFIVGADIVVALLLFGLLTPWARRAGTRSAVWGLALGVVGLVAVPIAFWSGVVIVIAGAGALLGLHARRIATQAGRAAGLATAAVGVGVAALVLSTVLLVLGNTVLA
jgi:hypothetical protein